MKTAELKTYMKMPSVPAGAILNRLISRQNRKKVEICAAANIIPQRLNDLIMGNRRFTPENSLALEMALGIDFPGFFYLLQANNDIYKAQQVEDSLTKPDLNILTKTTFWDVDINKINWKKCRAWAIRRVLEYGNADEICELARFYGQDAIMEIYNQPESFRLYDKVEKKVKELAL